MNFDRNVPTSEDWYPTYPDGTVNGRVYVFPENGGYAVAISFWGADDHGVHLVIPHKYLRKAQSKYQWWMRWMRNLKSIDHQLLWRLGFKNI